MSPRARILHIKKNATAETRERAGKQKLVVHQYEQHHLFEIMDGHKGGRNKATKDDWWLCNIEVIRIAIGKRDVDLLSVIHYDL